MKKHIYILLVFMISFSNGRAQSYEDFIGAGHSGGITVTTSDNYQLYAGLNTASGDKTISGEGLEGAQMEAARFLSQATFGADIDLIKEVAEVGIEAWLDEQFSLPPTFFTDSMESIYAQSEDIYAANGSMGFFPPRPGHVHMDFTWLENSMKGADAVRQRVAYALSQIMVIGLDGDLRSYSMGVANYYDVLVRNAFGNYEDLLFEVSTHPAMGYYLTHLNNPKTDEANNIHPDENYAREVMQLFSIGLDKLNPDGTPMLDANGERIPTYDNEDISELAKVFTGLGIGARSDGLPPAFGQRVTVADFRVPMKMYEEWHEPGAKYLLDGYVIPPGQTGMEDVRDAIRHLLNHPNVGPFIGRRLIQRLVKSNPSPEYIADVTAAFNDNGSGVRGDMKAVIKAILLHPEARACSWIQDPEQGKLREPILRKTQFVKAFGVISPLDNYWNYSGWYMRATEQHPLRSPTVFNFYEPDYSPSGLIDERGLVAPEFGIYNTLTSIGYANEVYNWVESDRILRTAGYEGYLITGPNLGVLFEKSKDADVLLDYLDLLLTNGALTWRTRQIIKTTINTYPITLNGLNSRIKLATFLIMISPDYNILK